MDAPYHPSLTKPDIIVWQNLKRDIIESKQVANGHVLQKTDTQSTKEIFTADSDGKSTVRLLSNLNNPKSLDFQPTVFTGWDSSDISPWVQNYLVQPYTEWAETVVRRPTDIVFLTHILL